MAGVEKADVIRIKMIIMHRLEAIATRDLAVVMGMAPNSLMNSIELYSEFASLKSDFYGTTILYGRLGESVRPPPGGRSCGKHARPV